MSTLAPFKLVFFIIAIVLFILVGLNAVNHPRVNLLGWGLAFLAAGIVV